MSSPIAIVGMACRYPDADSVEQLFENSLAQRRSFRRIPEVRLAAAGYFDDSGRSADRSYARQAAVIEGFEFDRERFRVSRSSYAVTDLTHWLALTVAAEALEDIRFRGSGAGPSREAVRVVVGNTLAGEFSRANLMRLRWPYVRGVVAQHLRVENPCLDEAERARLLRELEARYKRPFPVPDEDFLAGGLANTIAGRICNHFDFNGGGYTVDGACASSLLAVTDACAALASGDADMVLAGGVDLSLDPFELVGFSRTAALARNEMLVYDEDSEGFWPGEGCGFVALMRYEEALEQCEHIHAVIRGWGISSDGKGGLTRPEAAGQMLALDRAYRRAGYGIESVGYFEGHGTGTKVGDAAELAALITARVRSGQPMHPAVISSIKANIGHTKAAAGLAGLLRATKCVGEGILPPTTACRRPHALFAENPHNLTTSDQLQTWASDKLARRAGVSAMGFGGINTHLTIEEAPAPARISVAARGTTSLGQLRAFQDAELFLFAAQGREAIARTVAHVASFAGTCSRAELTDLAVELAQRAGRETAAPWRAGVVAATPAGLARKLEQLSTALADPQAEMGGGLTIADGVFFSARQSPGKIGLIFPGQGAPARAGGGIHARRFAEVQRSYQLADLATSASPDDTGFAQPAIAAASLGGLEMLRRLGVDGDVAIGHSLGELAALHWAGCYDGPELLAIARARGQAMADEQATAGAMVAIAAGREQALAAIGGQHNLFVANLNSPRQTVVSGGREEVTALAARLRREGVAATLLPVRHAFHSPPMAGVAGRFRKVLATVGFREAGRRIISTVTGAPLPASTDIATHLCDQLVSPVNFLAAASLAAREVDLFLEVGPGDLLANLVRSSCDTPVISIDVGGTSLAPFLHAAAAAFVLGCAPSIASLFDDRFARRFDWDWAPKFFQNPCEAIAAEPDPEPEAEPAEVPLPVPSAGGGDTLERLRQLIAERTGLPAGALHDDSRMLSDLHLNSITVGGIVADATAAAGLQSPVDPTEYANASLAEIAISLDQLAGSAAGKQPAPTVAGGVGSWVRYFEACREPAAPPGPGTDREPGTWHGFGASAEPADAVLAALNAGRHGTGTVLWLSADPGAPELPPLLQAAQHCARRAHESGGPVSFVVVQHGWGASGFARSFFLENPAICTLVINLPARADTDLGGAIVGEIDAASEGFREVFIGDSGQREEARLRLVQAPPPAAGSRLLAADDVVLVTGGGKGISAECGFQLARHSGCALLILGRSAPADNAELANNLDRLRRDKLRVSYQQADVTDAGSVAAAVGRGIAELGSPVTGIVHGAGLNHPRTVEHLSLADLEATVAPKLDGLRNLLAAVDPGQLKLLATFSSIIARIGLQGEADYALANEWLSHETDAFQSRFPGCRCRAIEWSVWSGTGMGQRLGRLDALVAQGITPISIDDGVREFLQLVETADLPTQLIVSGRFGNPPTIASERPPLGRSRFLASIPVYYPGIELIAEWPLSAASDPYLDDHVLDGERLFPAVMALEAMAEAVIALLAPAGDALALRFREVAFRKAIVAPADDHGDPLTLRLAALADPAGNVSLAIRSSATGFQVNHVEAHCTLRDHSGGRGAEPEFQHLPADEIRPFDPDQALYHNVLFQGGRFQRIQAYQLIEARRCSSQLSSDGAAQWFSNELPQACLLGDPGARDAALHAIQACIPHKIVIPIAVEEIEAGTLDPFQPYRMFAKEIADRGHELVYDLTIYDRDGRAVERWRGITLRVMGEPPHLRLNAPPLVAPFFERHVAASLPEAELRVSITPSPDSQAARNAPLHAGRRPDGKPDPTAGPRFHSAAYSGGWKLAVDGAIPVGCDLQSVLHRDPHQWAELLGTEGFNLAEAVSGITREGFDLAATRVWTAREAMKKAGLAAGAPLVVDPDSSPRWVVLSSGDSTIFSSLIDPPPDAPGICVAAAVSPTRSGVTPQPAETLPARSRPLAAAPAFEYRHVISFQETNVVGNVYYSNHIAWQGRCREMFLREHCPDVVEDLRSGLTLATTRCSCEYFHELHAFDEVVIRMRLGAIQGNRVEMTFEYYQQVGGEDQRTEHFAARGVQEIACMRTRDGISQPAEIPAGMRRALEKYRSS